MLPKVKIKQKKKKKKINIKIKMRETTNWFESFTKPMGNQLAHRFAIREENHSHEQNFNNNSYHHNNKRKWNANLVYSLEIIYSLSLMPFFFSSLLSLLDLMCLSFLVPLIRPNTNSFALPQRRYALYAASCKLCYAHTIFVIDIHWKCIFIYLVAGDRSLTKKQCCPNLMQTHTPGPFGQMGMQFGGGKTA